MVKEGGRMGERQDFKILAELRILQCDNHVLMIDHFDNDERYVGYYLW